MRGYILIFFTVVFALGCTRSCGSKHSSMSPEQVVEAYLDTALNMKNADQLPYLSRFTTGNLKLALETASAETITNAYIKRKFQIEGYSVVERTDRRPREVEIVFQLSFKETTGGAADDSATITTENTVSVVRQNDLWLISNVLGKKTTIDFPVSAESIIKASPGDGLDDEDIDEGDTIYELDASSTEIGQNLPADQEPQAGDNTNALDGSDPSADESVDANGQ